MGTMEPAKVPEIEMDYDCDVYEPAEDTYLFLDALQDELPFLQRLDPAICVEIGCGSGAVFVYLATELEKRGTRSMFLATDINTLATNVATRTATINGAKAFDIGLVDVLLFNPPYVPTPPHEVGSTGIEAAWAGGLHGREVIDRLLPKIKDLLSPRGVFYMVVVIENKPKEIASIMARDGFEMTVVRATQAKNERLSILKFTRTDDSCPAPEPASR